MEDLSNSPYAYELSRGVADLRFAEPLEANYRIAHLRRARLRVRAWFTWATVLSIGFAVMQARSAGLASPLSVAQLMHVPFTLTLLWLAWSRHYERYYLSVARVLMPVLNGLIAIFIANRHGGDLAGEVLNLVAVFFFTGLLFRQAILVAIVTIISFAAAAIVIALPLDVIVHFIGNMTVTSILGAIVCQDTERAHRRNFLEAALIGEMVARDGLSGLMNRRAFDEHLARVWQHALRDQRSIAVLMIDIDHFKAYNDEFGHQAGDEALRRVAQTVQEFTRRPLDLAARYGGEEFAAILYDLALPHVQDTAQRLRESVQNLKVRVLAADPLRATDAVGNRPDVTVSVGVAFVIPALGRTPAGVVQLADEALYEAKDSGRNRIVVKGTDAYQGLDTGAFQAPQLRRNR
ncbi:MAG: GGDEF domain-containing protein [Pseudomonadota bacterium]|nr:GGDEF domain-containing protein [Pseudomonadota bacterium]